MGDLHRTNLPAFPKPLLSGNYPAIEAMRISLARRLVRDRRAVGLTRVELARRARIAVESLNRIEKGKLTPTMGTLQKIDRALEQPEKAHARENAKTMRQPQRKKSDCSEFLRPPATRFNLEFRRLFCQRYPSEVMPWPE